jgi:hypothetical protein
MNGDQDGVATLSTRDQVAIHCLQGLLANHEITHKGHSSAGGPRRAVEMAYEYADALIEASGQEP